MTDDWFKPRKMTPEEFRALPQIQHFLNEVKEELAAKAAYERVVQDLIACAHDKAFLRCDDKTRWDRTYLIEMAIRLAWNCSKNYEGVGGFRSMMECKFREALEAVIVNHPKYIAYIARKHAAAAKRKAAANKRKRTAKAKP